MYVRTTQNGKGDDGWPSPRTKIHFDKWRDAVSRVHNAVLVCFSCFKMLFFVACPARKLDRWVGLSCNQAIPTAMKEPCSKHDSLGTRTSRTLPTTTTAHVLLFALLGHQEYKAHWRVSRNLDLHRCHTNPTWATKKVFGVKPRTLLLRGRNRKGPASLSLLGTGGSGKELPPSTSIPLATDCLFASTLRVYRSFPAYFPACRAHSTRTRKTKQARHPPLQHDQKQQIPDGNAYVEVFQQIKSSKLREEPTRRADNGEPFSASDMTHTSRNPTLPYQ